MEGNPPPNFMINYILNMELIVISMAPKKRTKYQEMLEAFRADLR